MTALATLAAVHASDHGRRTHTRARTFGVVVPAHDDVNQRAGAERVALELARLVCRTAPVGAGSRSTASIPERPS